MKTIIFVTGNKRKVGEARIGCELLNIRIKQATVEIDEIQSRDPVEISKHKAESAYKKINKPLVVSDTFWNIPALNGFPGAYMKDVAFWFGCEDFINLMRKKNDRRISFIESITYKDKRNIKIFNKEYWGSIVNKPRGGGNSIENITEFEGFTLGERRDQGGYSHKPEDYIWYDFAKWYSKI